MARYGYTPPLDRYAGLAKATPRTFSRCCALAVERPLANGHRYDCPVHGKGDAPAK